MKYTQKEYMKYLKKANEEGWRHEALIFEKWKVMQSIADSVVGEVNGMFGQGLEVNRIIEK